MDQLVALEVVKMTHILDLFWKVALTEFAREADIEIERKAGPPSCPALFLK